MRLIIITVLAICLLPHWANAQVAEGIHGLQGVLDHLYDQMMPLCGQLIGVARGLGGFAALFYIGSRVWKHLANAEAIDFYPLLRPFAIGFCIINFPLVIGIINGVMKLTVSGTAAMVEGANSAIEELLRQKQAALEKTELWQLYVGVTGGGDRDRWYKYTYDESPASEGMMAGIGNDIRFAAEKAGYNFRNSVKEWMSEILRVIYEAAALCINTLRTFQLVVLSILGPLVFAIAIFDGFQHTLTVWLARFINVFLWLPVANIFGAVIGKVQEEMLKLDLQQVSDAGYTTMFSPTDIGYLIFLIMGIVGYFTVPSVANYIVHAAGGGALQQKVTGMLGGATGAAVGLASGGAGAVLGAGFAGSNMAADMMGDAASRMSNDMAQQQTSGPYFKNKLEGK